jgi:hypothetical protein
MTNLRSVLIATLFILFSSSAIQGQAALLVLLFGDKVASENFYFSLKAGANYSSISNLDNSKADWGLNFGLGMNIKLSDKFFLTPDFMPLSQKGVKDIDPIPTGDAELDLRLQDPSSTFRALNYLDIPVLLKYKVTDEFSISAGPLFSILLSGADTYEVDQGSDDFLRYENNIESQLNTLDYGAALELTYELADARKGKGLRIHAKYALGISDILKDNSGDALTNSVFQFGVSFPFIENKKDE